MTSIRKFAYATLLAFTTLNFAPSLASAQEARGKFTLTHDVYFGSIKVSAGEYEFSFDPDTPVTHAAPQQAQRDLVPDTCSSCPQPQTPSRPI